VLKDGGYDITIASPSGGAVPIDDASLQGDFKTPECDRMMNDGESEEREGEGGGTPDSGVVECRRVLQPAPCIRGQQWGWRRRWWYTEGLIWRLGGSEYASEGGGFFMRGSRCVSLVWRTRRVY